MTSESSPANYDVKKSPVRLFLWNFSHLNTAQHPFPNWYGPHGVSCLVGTHSPKTFSSSDLQDETSQLLRTCFQSLLFFFFQSLHFKGQGSQEEFTQREDRERGRMFRIKKGSFIEGFQRTTWKFMAKTRSLLKRNRTQEIKLIPGALYRNLLTSKARGSWRNGWST